jgi:signal transduction histidine kinase/ligand-binding sensor domain-containing protein
MKKYLLIVLLLASMQNGNAQSPHLKFDHFTVKDGLPQEDVIFLKQDDQGYLWMGTLNGLVRYDGYKFKVYQPGTGEGAALPTCSVLSMIIDKHKNLWFSTIKNGLFRYNRSTDDFTQFRYPPKTNNNSQLLVFADSNDNLWGYDGAFADGQAHIVKFNTESKQFSSIIKIKKTPNIIKLTADIQKSSDFLFKSESGSQSIWLGTDNGLLIYNKKEGRFRPYLELKDTSRQKSIKNIYEAPSEPGVLWLNAFDHFSKQYVVERVDTRNKTVKDYIYNKSPGIKAANDTVTTTYEDRKHRLWFASNTGLKLFNRETETFTNYFPVDTDKEAGKNRVFSITEAKNGSLWLISGKGLLNFDPETHLFHRYTANPDDPDALSWNEITCLLLDRSGTLWAGTYYRGLDKLNVLSSAFATYTKNSTTPYGYPGNNTKQIAAATDGNVLFTNTRGIYKWKPGNDQFLPVYKLKLPDLKLRAIAAGNDGAIYFCDNTGFKVYNPMHHTLQSYVNDPKDAASLSSNNINHILQDHTGTVWIATNDKGICTFNPLSHKFTQYPFISNDGTRDSGDKLDDQRALTIYEDRLGTIWVGTNLGGLNRFDRKTGKFKSYLLDGQPHVYCILSMLDDRKGRFWVGSYLLGLFEFDRETGHYIKRINENNGLLLNTVLEIEDDKKDFLWINSDRGLTRLDPQNLSLKTFPINSLLPGKVISQPLQNFTSVNGQMVMGLTNGITSFNPADLDGNPYPPVVHIEKVAYSNPASTSDSVTTQITYGLDKIDLPWNQNRITFNYVALHFANPAQNKYAYLLDGYDNHWIKAGTQRSATYTNLSSGAYTFHVKASNSDGVWNNTGDSFTIIIHAPWWLRWWAWVIYVFLFVMAVYAFIAYRSRKLTEDKRVLEHKVQLRTEEVLQQKEEIEAQRDNLEKAFDGLKTAQNQLIQSEKMASLGELTAGIAHEIQNPLNFVNNFSEVNTELIDEMQAEIDKGNFEEVKEIAVNVKENQQKINQHGKRADFIVKGMLQHSRTSTGEREPTNINVLADEFFKLSYHGLRAKDKSFNAEITTHFDPDLPKIKVVQQDIGRVLLNLFNNAFYAVNQKQKITAAGYKPEVTVTTSSENGQVIIKVKDNGVGIPDTIKEKIMQPFFTTKPTGEGTGLGLSLAYDMVVKGHGGSIEVNTKENEFTEFIIHLPL